MPMLQNKPKAIATPDDQRAIDNMILIAKKAGVMVFVL